MNQLFKPDINEQIACIEREINMRQRVYPKWVAAGKMSKQKADREIEIMGAVLHRLYKIQESGAE